MVNMADWAIPKRTSLPSMLVQADVGQQRVALAFGPKAQAQANEEDDTHGGKDAAPLAAEDAGGQALAALRLSVLSELFSMLFAAVPHHFAKGDDAGAGQNHHGIQFDQVRQDRGVFKRRCGVGAQKAAAVRAEMLDDLKRGDGAHGDRLVCTLQRLYNDIPVKVLGHALPYQQQAAHDGEGNQDAGGDADKVHEEVAHIILGLTGKAADERDAGGIAGGRGDEHHKDDDQHLAEVAQATFTGIVL